MTFKVIEVRKEITFQVVEPFSVGGTVVMDLANEVEELVSIGGNPDKNTVTIQLVTETHEEMEDAEMQLYQTMEKYFELKYVD